MWVIAFWELFKALIATLLFIAEVLQDEVSGYAKETRARDRAKEKAEAERKATFWDRAKAEREEDWRQSQEAIKATQAMVAKRQEDQRRSEARARARQMQLDTLWAKSAPKSTKWKYKI